MEHKARLIQLLPIGRRQWMLFFSFVLLFAGFSLSRLFISLGVIALCLCGLFFQDLRLTAALFLKRRSFLVNLLFFVVILFSGINSADHNQWLNFLRLKLPFLLLPFAFCGIKEINRGFLNLLFFSFILVMSISAAGVMIYYALHFEDINQHILWGSVIPVPFSHIRYTLLLVMAFFACLWLFEEWRKPVLLVPVAFLFIVIHMLSSRSGWLALYAGLFFYTGHYLYRSRRLVLGLVLLGIIVSMPFFLYRVLPSFRYKIKYMDYNLQEYKAGNVDNLSDALRITSLYTGVEVIKRHPLWGTGVGDLPQECRKVSAELFPNIRNEEDRKMPHNQFIWIWAASGFLGFFAYTLAIFYPLLIYRRSGTWLFGVFYVIFLSSFLTEPSLEEQIGGTFYIVFLLLFISCFENAMPGNE